MSAYREPRVSADETQHWHDVLTTLTELRKRTGVDIGDYMEAQVRIGPDGVSFRLVWDNETESYSLAEIFK